ncbi:MAG: phosphate/phosphite/phosphonate ABC transporter substrate-binding protein [Pseudanabaena sp.]|jgi:phosphonate transport system substrate-binding protein|nr:PhnD/SsuA/transferrin family substrate-binding protein [Pseudanabaena sp. M53BS1SP1A06MG]MCA6581247.1 PhnD/SsuA/transferrin family substrate-binding protein [Pseudanabaena sp. M34BS1SP1A06MG]MCA6592772.1 PhnD/SsuA/transferrin family substrate-binding protein [Pseudanabaena sp. M38BS1SP1A06MG]MCA6601534.1 PhnD/SsuA/transferrin family substrate-binding protein [Pseudanabaena sp. M57BS1SP1A06MG]
MHRLLSQNSLAKALLKPVNLLVALGCISLVGLTACSDSNQQTTSQSNQSVTKTADKEPPKDSQPKPTVATQAPIKEITIAFATRRDTKDLQSKVDQVSSILSKEIGIPVKGVIGDETASVEALRANRANVAFVSGRAALKAEDLSGAKMYLAEVREDYSGGKTYKSVFVIPEDSPLKTLPDPQKNLEQLRGKRMAFTSRSSGSGFIFPVSELVGLKFVDGPDRLEQFFSKVTYGDGYSSALQAVLRDQADVAVVSEYALLPPWVTTEEGKKLRVLHAVANVPAHGISIDDSVPTDVREKLITAFLKLNEPANNGLFRSMYNSTQLVKVDHDTHLAPMRTAIQRAGLKP